MRTQFVRRLLADLLDKGTVHRSDAVLCVCAGSAEREVFSDLEFARVTISNLDERMMADSFAPFGWSFQDAQALTFEDGAFDVVFVADGLHHCSSPHRALTEMYRVARKSIIVVESRDNALMRLANRLGLSPNYELEAVVDNNFRYGGVDNKPIPNFIFRWTEVEFEKTLNSYDPIGPRSYHYRYDLNLPYDAAKFRKSAAKFWIIKVAEIPLRILLAVFKKQRNTLAMIAVKPDRLWPWLRRDDGQIVFESEYARKFFKGDDAT